MKIWPRMARNGQDKDLLWAGNEDKNPEKVILAQHWPRKVSQNMT